MLSNLAHYLEPYGICERAIGLSGESFLLLGDGSLFALRGGRLGPSREFHDRKRPGFPG
jgi:hypothetical protein